MLIFPQKGIFISCHHGLRKCVILLILLDKISMYVSLVIILTGFLLPILNIIQYICMNFPTDIWSVLLGFLHSNSQQYIFLRYWPAPSAMMVIVIYPKVYPHFGMYNQSWNDPSDTHNTLPFVSIIVPYLVSLTTIRIYPAPLPYVYWWFDGAVWFWIQAWPSLSIL